MKTGWQTISKLLQVLKHSPNTLFHNIPTSNSPLYQVDGRCGDFLLTFQLFCLILLIHRHLTVLMEPIQKKVKSEVSVGIPVAPAAHVFRTYVFCGAIIFFFPKNARNYFFCVST